MNHNTIAENTQNKIIFSAKVLLNKGFTEVLILEKYTKRTRNT